MTSVNRNEQRLDGPAVRARRLELGLSQAKLSEMSSVSQHLISSFELGKTSLADEHLNAVQASLGNAKNVSALVKRSKRYQEHRYVEVEKRPERVARARAGTGNADYLKCLETLAEDHLSKTPKKYSALSLFAGCGGFSLGASAAGFAVKGFVELEADLREIYRSNFPSSIELGSDIAKIDDDAIKEALARIGAVDLIVGGPPCQGFSLSGKRAVNDPRNTLFRHYLRFVDAFKPKIAILENVRLLTSMKNAEGGFVRDDIKAEFSRHGYKIQFFEVNASQYGVPQHRERVLFVAVRDDLNLKPSIPSPVCGEQDMLSDLARVRTFGDACGDLEYLESGHTSTSDAFHEAVKHPAHVIEWLWNVQEGRSAHDNEEPHLRPPSGYNTTYKRQVWNEPASTVQTTFGMISGCRNVHPIATRSLTIREAARVQSFPDSYRFPGNLGTVRTGIGNAVPPLLAYRLATHAKQLLDLVEVARL
jgi:DNA (cytosine-5)-methyltransferase 1